MIQPICKDVFFLSRPSRPAQIQDSAIGADLLDTLKANQERCVGMAANMIGQAVRIIAVDNGGQYIGCCYKSEFKCRKLKDALGKKENEALRRQDKTVHEGGSCRRNAKTTSAEILFILNNLHFFLTMEIYQEGLSRNEIVPCFTGHSTIFLHFNPPSVVRH